MTALLSSYYMYFIYIFLSGFHKRIVCFTGTVKVCHLQSDLRGARASRLQTAWNGKRVRAHYMSAHISPAQTAELSRVSSNVCTLLCGERSHTSKANNSALSACVCRSWRLREVLVSLRPSPARLWHKEPWLCYRTTWWHRNMHCGSL